MLITAQQIATEAKSGNWNAAQTDVQQAIQAHPNSALAWYYQAEIQEHFGKPADALQSLARAEKLTPAGNTAALKSIAVLRAKIETTSGTRHQAYQTVPSALARNASAANHQSGFGILPILLLVGVAFIIFRLISRKTNAPYSAANRPGIDAGTQNPPPPIPGQIPQQDHTLRNTFLGAAGGMLAGEALKNMFEHGHESQPPQIIPQQPDNSGSDSNPNDFDSGSAFGSSFDSNDSGSSDSGGGFDSGDGFDSGSSDF